MQVELARLIIIGVASGIVTSATLFVATRLFNKVLLPWYRQVTYTGIHVAGEWRSLQAPFDQDIKLELAQKANALTGFAVYVNKNDDETSLEKIRSFRVAGSINDRFLQLSLVHTDPSRIGVINYLLEVVGDGRRMVGAASFYDLEKTKVAHADISFLRFAAAAKAQIDLPST